MMITYQQTSSVVEKSFDSFLFFFLHLILFFADDDDDVWLQSVYMTDAVVCTYMETIVAVYVTISLLIKFYSIIIDTILFT